MLQPKIIDAKAKRRSEYHLLKTNQLKVSKTYLKMGEIKVPKLYTISLMTLSYIVEELTHFLITTPAGRQPLVMVLEKGPGLSMGALSFRIGALSLMMRNPYFMKHPLFNLNVCYCDFHRNLSARSLLFQGSTMGSSPYVKGLLYIVTCLACCV